MSYDSASSFRTAQMFSLAPPRHLAVGGLSALYLLWLAARLVIGDAPYYGIKP